MIGLVRASLRHYWRVHLLVALAVAVAVAVTAGSLLVGASMRTSLHRVTAQRIGTTDLAIGTATGFGARLGAAMVVAAPDTIPRTASLISVIGTVTHSSSGRVAPSVRIYGVDDAFWAFHGVPAVALSGREGAVSASLAADLGVRDGDGLVVRASRPSDIPLGTLPGRRDQTTVRVQVTATRTIGPDRMGDFSVALSHAPVHALFVPLSLLQRELSLAGRVNTILVQQAARAGATGTGRGPVDAVQRAWLAGATLPDHGVRIRRVPGDRVMALEGLGGYIDPEVSARVLSTLARLQRPGIPALTYLVTAIRVGDRAVPYSAVAAIDVDGYNRLSVPAGPPAPGTETLSDGDALVRGSLQVNVGRGGVRVGRVQVTEADRARGRTAPAPRESRPPEAGAEPAEGPIWLNEWAADDLDARLGDAVRLEYLVWTDRGALEPRSASFTLQGVQPMMRIGGDRTLTPDYPGITDAPDLGSWVAPFPVDRSRVRPRDEAYWNQWRAAPKAYIPLEIGQRLWGTRFGDVSSIRFALRDADAVAAAVRQDTSRQVVVRPVREDAMAAAAGAPDFGLYLLVASIVLIAAALLVACLGTVFNLARRTREVGMLAAMGYPAARIRRQFLGESVGAILAGTVVGAAGAVGNAALLLHGLRTWWNGAVGTNLLQLHVDPVALASGTIAAALAALAVVWLATTSLSRQSPRALITGILDEPRAFGLLPILLPGLTVTAIAVAGAAATGIGGRTTGFVVAGGFLLVVMLALVHLVGGRRASGRPATAARSSLLALGRSNLARRPARTALAIALIASASFGMVSLLALRRDAASVSLAREGGTGGFAWVAESAAPLMPDPSSDEGRSAVGLDPGLLRGARVTPLRLRDGDEASLLNSYQPLAPRIVGVRPADMEGRFTFAAVMEGRSGTSPWQWLDQEDRDGAVPAIVDQTTLTASLHLRVGDRFSFAPDGITPITLRIVAALADSVLQSEVIIGDASFVRLFPWHEGHRIWLVEAPAASSAAIGKQLADLGLDVVGTRERLSSYYRVGNARLGIAQILVALGLIVGGLGLGAALALHGLERQREWSLLHAVGYSPAHLRRLVVAECGTLVAGGVVIGAACGAVAAAPALAGRIDAGPLITTVAILAAVVLVALVGSIAGLRIASSPIPSGLRAE